MGVGWGSAGAAGRAPESATEFRAEVRGGAARRGGQRAGPSSRHIPQSTCPAKHRCTSLPSPHLPPPSRQAPGTAVGSPATAHTHLPLHTPVTEHTPAPVCTPVTIHTHLSLGTHTCPHVHTCPHAHVTSVTTHTCRCTHTHLPPRAHLRTPAPAHASVTVYIHLSLGTPVTMRTHLSLHTPARCGGPSGTEPGPGALTS